MMNQYNEDFAEIDTNLNRFPFKLFPSIAIALILLLLSFAGIPLAFKIESLILLVSSIIGILVGAHLISVSRVAQKYRKIILHIPKIKKATMNFWHLECLLEIEKKGFIYVLFFVWYCPYGTWIAMSYGIPSGGGPPEHYQVWKFAPWWKNPVHMNPYDFDRYLDRGLIGTVMARMMSQPVEKGFSIIDEQLEMLIPQISDQFKSPDNLRRVGFARKRGRNILLAVLGKSADPENIATAVEILNEVEAKLGKI